MIERSGDELRMGKRAGTGGAVFMGAEQRLIEEKGFVQLLPEKGRARHRYVRGSVLEKLATKAVSTPGTLQEPQGDL